MSIQDNLAGLPIGRTRLAVLVASGLAAGLAGLLLVGQAASRCRGPVPDTSCRC
jgi:ribose/xylose/arabinose/galactoside ABC-type transport system permease subunit